MAYYLPTSTEENMIERACKYIGVSVGDFDLRKDMFLRESLNPLHGVGHLYRTMIACALLGEKLQKPRMGLLAFCGAYIHDLARTNDDCDECHGADAARIKFPQFEALWDKYALTPQEREWVCEAVAQHSTTEWMQRGDEGYDVMAILKDADALERCRIYDLNEEMLRYEESRSLVTLTEVFCFKTLMFDGEIGFKEFIVCLMS